MSIHLSESSGDILSRLQRSFRLGARPPLLRLALAIGLRRCGGLMPAQTDSKGREIPVKVVSGGAGPLWDALILEAVPCLDALDSAKRKRAYKCLIDLGLSEIANDVQAEGTPGDYLARLAREHYEEKV